MSGRATRLQSDLRPAVEHFDRCAQSYHESAFMSPGLRAVSERDLAAVLFAAGLAPGVVACDVGVGTGRIAELLIGQGFELVGVEASSEMIAQAHARLGGVDVRQASLPDRLPFVDGFADLVTAMRVLKYVADLPAALRELSRLLTPGGVVCFDVANVRSVARFGYPRGLVHLVSYSEVLSALDAAGLEVVAVANGVHVPDPVWRTVESHRSVALVSALQRLFDRSAGRVAARSWTFVATKPVTVSR
jgi:ubiquinone/menaquinone biosynthesis C-methylase UbiE